jgi:hypothetical protein
MTFARLLCPPSHTQAALSRSEVVTLALCGPWQGFGSERGLYRSAQRHLRAALPSLPTREPYHRQVRRQHAALVAFFLPLVRLLAAQCCAYEALDSSGVPTRDAQRRGAGWLPGLADILAGATAWAGMKGLCRKSPKTGKLKLANIDFPIPHFRILPPKGNFATEPYFAPGDRDVGLRPGTKTSVTATS